MFHGASTIEHPLLHRRQIVEANFAGSMESVPARLVSFQFNERICKVFERLRWWDMQSEWIRRNN